MVRAEVLQARGLSGGGRWPRRSCACRERYAGFTVKHFREELQQRHHRKNGRGG
jgi:hypothetical protein